MLTGPVDVGFDHDSLTPVPVISGAAVSFERALEAAGVEHELVTYEGAPHSFFDRKQEEFAEASDGAWRRTLGLIDAHR